MRPLRSALSVMLQVMEQLVDRLDVAMFNAILRENGEEMPTDPVSDPISDSKVLPIPAGRSSFGAGAQLKNAVSNWCPFCAVVSSLGWLVIVYPKYFFDMQYFLKSKWLVRALSPMCVISFSVCSLNIFVAIACLFDL